MSDFADNIRRFDQAIAAAGAPAAPFDALHALARDVIGVKLFTFMTIDIERQVASRFYTNDPVSYPASGTKPVEWNDWFDHVVTQRKNFVANTIADISKVFFDHELIASLGCGSVINMPIIIGDVVVGTLNMLHEEQYYTPERVALAEAHLSLPAKTAFLASTFLSQR